MDMKDFLPQKALHHAVRHREGCPVQGPDGLHIRQDHLVQLGVAHAVGEDSPMEGVVAPKRPTSMLVGAFMTISAVKFSVKDFFIPLPDWAITALPM